jgi:hypothetical protein
MIMRDTGTFFRFRKRKHIFWTIAYLTVLAAVLAACVRPNEKNESAGISFDRQNSISANGQPSEQSTRVEKPTTSGQHEVSLGETISTIAEQYGVSSEALMEVN